MDVNEVEKLAGPRWREVEQFAADRGITFGEAVIELVNKGLSYLDDN